MLVMLLVWFVAQTLWLLRQALLTRLLGWLLWRVPQLIRDKQHKMSTSPTIHDLAGMDHYLFVDSRE